MQGETVIRALRTCVSRFNEQLFQEKFGLWEGEAFLDKPFTITDLLEAVSLLVSGRLPSGGCA